MNLLIVMVLILNVLGTNSHCNIGCVFRKVVFVLFESDICHCVRTDQCYQEDISTQTTCVNIFDDVNPNYVCCRNPVRRTTVRPPPTQRPNSWGGWPWGSNKQPTQKPQNPTQGLPKSSTKIPAKMPPPQPTTQVPSQSSTQIPITNPPTQIQPSNSQPHGQDTSQASTPTHTDCNCMPLSDCHDGDFDSTIQQKQGSCQTPSHVCCLGLVQPETPPQDQSFNLTLQPEHPKPQPISPPTNKNCTCTPFFKCYDEETSSNLTGIVNDRLSSPNVNGVENDRTSIPILEEDCLDPNDVCCHNLVKITAKPTIEPSFEDCTGSCIPIEECPYHLSKLEEAQNGSVDVVQELRSLVCSFTNGNLRVCCPACQFPFIYKDITYSECTSIDDPDGEPWCSIQTDNRSNHIKDQWKQCTSEDVAAAAA